MSSRGDVEECRKKLMKPSFDQFRPLVAILRGLEPARAGAVGNVIVEAGFGFVEVPLNSPDPLQSISTLVATIGDRAIVGAGTVLTVSEVNAVADVGAGLVVSPNFNCEVIARTTSRGMLSFPGVLTPTEMFGAIDAGATGLKIFPAELVPSKSIKAVRAVLPPHLPVLVVGGIDAGNMGEYLAAGATGFGMGGSVFKPGKSLSAIADDARRVVEAFDNVASA